MALIRYSTAERWVVTSPTIHALEGWRLLEPPDVRDRFAWMQDRESQPWTASASPGVSLTVCPLNGSNETSYFRIRASTLAHCACEFDSQISTRTRSRFGDRYATWTLGHRKPTLALPLPFTRQVFLLAPFRTAFSQPKLARQLTGKTLAETRFPGLNPLPPNLTLAPGVTVFGPETESGPRILS